MFKFIDGFLGKATDCAVQKADWDEGNTALKHVANERIIVI